MRPFGLLEGPDHFGIGLLVTLVLALVQRLLDLRPRELAQGGLGEQIAVEREHVRARTGEQQHCPGNRTQGFDSRLDIVWRVGRKVDDAELLCLSSGRPARKTYSVARGHPVDICVFDGRLELVRPVLHAVDRDHLLRPPREAQIARRINDRNVSGLEPSIGRECLARRGLIVIVPREDDRASHLQVSRLIWLGQSAVPGEGRYTHFNARDALSHRGELTLAIEIVLRTAPVVDASCTGLCHSKARNDHVPGGAVPDKKPGNRVTCLDDVRFAAGRDVVEAAQIKVPGRRLTFHPAPQLLQEEVWRRRFPDSVTVDHLQEQ